jgi:DNA-directed RNA polymerase specialized sigma24 family protein
VLDVEALYRDNADYLHRSLRRRFDSSVPDALIEDACSATWVIAWEKRALVREENPLGWLVTVAWHEALALLRKRRLEVHVVTLASRPSAARVRNLPSRRRSRFSCSRASARTNARRSPCEPGAIATRSLPK